MFLFTWSDFGIVATVFITLFGYYLAYQNREKEKKAKEELEKLKAEYSLKNYRRQLFYDHEFIQVKKVFVLGQKITNEAANIVTHLEDIHIKKFSMEDFKKLHEELADDCDKMVDACINVRPFIDEDIMTKIDGAVLSILDADASIIKGMKNYEPDFDSKEIFKQINQANRFIGEAIILYVKLLN